MTLRLSGFLWAPFLSLTLEINKSFKTTTDNELYNSKKEPGPREICSRETMDVRVAVSKIKAEPPSDDDVQTHVLVEINHPWYTIYDGPSYYWSAQTRIILQQNNGRNMLPWILDRMILESYWHQVDYFISPSTSQRFKVM